MNHKQIERIVQEVFEKAKKGSVSHSKYALAKQVVKEIGDLNAKTLERAYARYIKKNDTISTPNPDTVNFLCKYIGYDDYQNYVITNSSTEIANIDKESLKKSSKKINKGVKKNHTFKKKYRWSLTLKIAIAFGIVILATN
ncbi:hypothetical protein [Dokdonia sp.]|uniref:hypothetical protein n=1 Tax=Dokdonia sp. TaxID=2024995 RepID=UPI00326590EE